MEEYGEESTTFSPTKSPHEYDVPTVASASSATKPPPSHSKYATASPTLKKMASSSTLGENKSSSRVATMHAEKAAAEKNIEGATTVAPLAPATKSATSSKPSAQGKRVSQVTSSQPAMKPSPSTALKSIHDHANKPTLSQPTKKPSPKKVEVKPLSPITSDREEESDSESDLDYERQGPKKTIPEWAQKENLDPAVVRQFADLQVDEIFDKKKPSYQRSTSSGIWEQDHIESTASEDESDDGECTTCDMFVYFVFHFCQLYKTN